ncbi:tyrosine-protein kinase receptor Tie-1-like, partial [Saccoglossus kowalevskii]|uniref:Tyrosine-protein kinase HCK-like n=1 Tax=Saccoglossus kowalevskii TaxID=10224 RepID=A0ABM0MXR5_SACKO
GRLPVRWMAPESILDGVYTNKSDVWSCGIVLWEIETLGGVPYNAMSTQEVIESVQHGYRMPRPDKCHQDMFSAMELCWADNPERRPTFQKLTKILQVILDGDK